MKHAILCRSYAPDFSFLSYLLRSIQKFCTGFSEIIIVVPDKDLGILKTWGLTKEKVVGVVDPPGDGYMAQQKSKVYADLYTDAEFIHHTDSDTCFSSPVTPDMFFRDNRPVMLITPYTSLGNTVPWQAITEKALQIPCPFETMRRLPWVFPTKLLPEFREYMQKIHGMPVEEYIMRQPSRSFSEFNAMGAWAHHFHPEEFYFLDTTKEPLPPTVLKQNWSWGGLTPEIKAELERILA